MTENNLVSFPSKILKEECSICLEELNTSNFLLTSCNHFFHIDCINNWKKKSTTCPLCRENNYKITCKYNNEGKEINNDFSCFNFISKLLYNS
jgi:SUMO ligase MMS21 Smc5/6 complex component